MMHEHLPAILSGLGGCVASAIIAKWVITKALADLSKLTEKVNHINETLAAIAVRLETLSGLEEEISEQSKKVAYLEARSRK